MASAHWHPDMDARRNAGFQAVVAAPFGHVGILTRDGRLTGIEYLGTDTPLLAPQDDFSRETCAQIAAYLADSRHRFDLPYVFAGTAFQRRVWEAIADIPSGMTRTYGALAAELGSGARAVGSACGSNPVPLVVPCHRVVGAGGRIGGFMHSRGAGPLSIKQWLLRHEGWR